VKRVACPSNSETYRVTAKATLAHPQPPRSMLLLRRAADAAGYAVAGAPDDEPAASRYPAPALFVASLVCILGFAIAIY
jgi:hypothetical protein